MAETNFSTFRHSGGAKFERHHKFKSNYHGRALNIIASAEVPAHYKNSFISLLIRDK